MTFTPFKSRKRFVNVARKGCPKCRGTKWIPAKWGRYGELIGPLRKCDCLVVIDLQAPKKEKREIFDGKMAALGKDA